ncbi:DUF4190 domain-containing protein [Paenibacillus sp. 481]|uniref:DUF4190 domain-containing protein n=1 Tax=Paenibacillus sp. 481 TaxID=2835869 RepID=UPI001E30011A|nr:DUF4190 domain-containing protein [Paenibacillus sp. 481]UHA74677.1 DUF4190 domain-containing protein [Paenibacillus sp. 481]
MEPDRSQQTSSHQYEDNQHSPSNKKQPKDRLGQAVVSMICGIFGLLLLILAWYETNIRTESYFYRGPDYTLGFIAASWFISIPGFILGVRARRSPKGRGMAIAGITLALISVGLMIASLVVTLWYKIKLSS